MPKKLRRASGFEVDLCRAIAATALGRPDAVRFQRASSVTEFLAATEADIVLRRLTVSATHEAPGQLEFGPIVLQDAQGILLDTRKAATGQSLAGQRVCVSANSNHETALARWARGLRRPAQIVVVDAMPGAVRWQALGCAGWSTDLTALLAMRADAPEPARYRLLPRRLADEPLAPLLKSDDPEFVRLVRWTLNGLISAARGGEIVVTEQLAQSLHFAPGGWQAAIAMGHLGDIEQRHFGTHGRLPLPGLASRRWQDGDWPLPTGGALR